VLGANSDDVSIDRAGRLCLPDGLAKKAGIASDAVLVGLWDRFQIWNPEFYEQVESVDQAHESAAKKMI
jgi:MraZ protein